MVVLRCCYAWFSLLFLFIIVGVLGCRLAFTYILEYRHILHTAISLRLLRHCLLLRLLLPARHYARAARYCETYYYIIGLHCCYWACYCETCCRYYYVINIVTLLFYAILHAHGLRLPSLMAIIIVTTAPAINIIVITTGCYITLMFSRYWHAGFTHVLVS